MKNLLHTKIIATIGPASNTVEKITELINAGVRSFRVNSSHGTPESHLQEIQNVRRAAQDLNIYIPIILDLQGPKIRAGILREPMNLKEGQVVILKPAKEQGNEDFIPVDYPELFKDLKPDDVILMDDGKIQMKITSTNAENIEAVVTDGGVLTSRKGINVPGVKLNVPSITQRDIDYIKFAVLNKVDYLALSFVRKKEDVLQVKEYCDIPVIAKIEKPEAVENLNEIMAVSDGIMVARGDLGIEISPQRVPIVQKHIIKEANSHKKEVITATQMLESMMHEPIPTRAEASDVANAIIDGTDAIMLSGETAVGEYPVEAVKIMRSIAENVEDSNLCQYNTFEPSDEDSQIIASAAIRMLEQTTISAIVAFTRSGFTARLISKAKPSVPVIAISDNKAVCDRLNLLWGVFPFYMEFGSGFNEEFLAKLDEFLINNTSLKKGDKVVITGGMPSMGLGTTNFVRIHQVQVQ
ncbi:MAG: pyruvate kinase [Candidatus Melainabacteria bacterium GWF2_37_15]|nr:MAG: pyruvate kinase [Candidatus Melainabacteria bacterium GWF2_37_15]